MQTGAAGTRQQVRKAKERHEDERPAEVKRVHVAPRQPKCEDGLGAAQDGWDVDPQLCKGSRAGSEGTRQRGGRRGGGLGGWPPPSEQCCVQGDTLAHLPAEGARRQTCRTLRRCSLWRFDRKRTERRRRGWRRTIAPPRGSADEQGAGVARWAGETHSSCNAGEFSGVCEVI